MAGLLNANFVLDLTSERPASLAASVVSDLSVPGRPDAWAFRLADSASAVLVMGLALALAWRAWRRRRGVLVGAGCCLAAFAASTATAAVVTESCARTLVRGCAEATPADGLHDTVSTLGSGACIGAMVLLAMAARRRPLVSATHLVASLVSAALSAALVVGASVDATAWFGEVQRLQIVVLSVWLALAGRAVDALAGTPGASSGTATARMGT
jgi:hypothetical protein